MMIRRSVVVDGELLLSLYTIEPRRSSQRKSAWKRLILGMMCMCPRIPMLVQVVYLSSGHFRKGLQGRPILVRLHQVEVNVGRLGLLHLLLLPGLQSSGRPRGRDAVEHEAGIDAVLFGYGRASLRQMGGKTIDSALGEVLAAKLACLRIPVQLIVSKMEMPTA